MSALNCRIVAERMEAIADDQRLGFGYRRDIAEAARILRAAEEVSRAVEDVGRSPAHHREVMRATERSWPTLMAAVRRLVEAR